MIIAASSGWVQAVVALVALFVIVGLLLVGLRVVAIVLRLLWRLVTWPFRALRPKPPTGAGADYEAMIRQQPGGRPVSAGSAPPYWPPPPATARPQTTAESVYAGRILPPPPRELPPSALPDESVFRYRKGWSWTISLVATFMVIGAISLIGLGIDGMHGQNVAGDVAIPLAVVYWLWSWRRWGRVPIIRIGSQVPGERAEFEAWRAARNDAELAEFRAWKAERDGTAEASPEQPPEPPVSKPSIDTF
jgi:hypothetical protein